MSPRGKVVFTLVATLLVVSGLVHGAAAAGSGGWFPLGNGGSATTPSLNGTVRTFTRVGSTLYVGGQFEDAGGLPQGDRIAVWNGSSWSALGGLPGTVYAIAVDGTDVYVGGAFQDAGGDPQADNLAVWDGTSWGSVGGAAFVGPILALAISGDDLYVGGGFDDAAGLAGADGVAVWSLAGGGWRAITGNEDIGGTVNALAVGPDGSVYVGGTFVDADGIAAADRVARYAGGVWSSLGSAGGDGAIGAVVRDIAVAGSNVYVAGDFSNAGGVGQADRIAVWNGSSWSALGTLLADTGATSIYAVAVDGSTVFVGGYFLDAGGDALLDHLAAFVDGGWTNLGTDAGGSNGAQTGTVYDLAVVGGRLYAGGLTGSIGGSPLNGFAAWFPLRQPDGRIGLGSGGQVGDDVYNRTGKRQSELARVGPGRSATFTVSIQNDGLRVDTFRVEGSGGEKGFSVKYLAGGSDVSAQVRDGTYEVADLAPGEVRSLTVKVTIAKSLAAGARATLAITATSQGAGAASDTVKATVRVI